MQLYKVSDPRHPISRLSRKELEYLAMKEGRKDIVPGMPAELMKRAFMGNPPSVLPRPMRPTVGSQKPLRTPPYEEWLRVAFGQERAAPVEQEAIEANALDDLQAQWEAEQARLAVSPPPKPKQREPKPKFTRPAKRIPPIVSLRQECKKRGIAYKMTDKVVDLESRLNGKDPA